MLRRLLPLLLFAVGSLALAQASPQLRESVDALMKRCLQADGTPSASVALIVDGRIAYEKAYGYERLQPATRATPQTRYQVASVSKIFTAQAVLQLEAEGLLSLEDKVSRWFPDLTEAGSVTVRELLNHTSGYPDHYPTSYPAGPRAATRTPDAIVGEWGRHPLLFAPGTQYRYSNLEYEIAGRIVEKVSGKPLFGYLQEHVFGPAGMTSVLDLDAIPPGSTLLATGYMRQALGPLETAPYEGPGWSFGAGQVVTTAHDLAMWDLAFLAGTVLPTQQAAEETTRAQLKDGTRLTSGLGIFVGEEEGVTRFYHSGQGLGFEAVNVIYPAAHAAIVILTNTSAAQTASRMLDQLQYLLVPLGPQAAFARAVFTGLQAGAPDKTNWTSDLKAHLDKRALITYRTSLGPLGPLQSLSPRAESTVDGLTTRDYDLMAGGRALRLHLLLTSDGKLEDLTVSAD